MVKPTLNQRWAAQLAGALVANGVRHVVLAPGSRSTALALAFADRYELQKTVVVDERSAGFVALGLAKATRRAVAMLCTSGTAGAHFLPSLMEAQAEGVQLIALTADRPWELQHCGAPQTVAQTGLFGRFVALSEALPLPEDHEPAFRHLAARIARAVYAKGGAHFNVPFREPLGPPLKGSGLVLTPQQVKVSSASTVGDEQVRAATQLLRAARRPLVVCGPRNPQPGLVEALTAFSKAWSVPVLAEAASNARYGVGGAIACSDVLLRCAPFAEAVRPDWVLRLGGGLTPKGPQAWLDRSRAHTVVVAETDEVIDPGHVAAEVWAADPISVLQALTANAESSSDRLQSARQWAKASAVVEKSLREVLNGSAISEMSAARELVAALPPESALMISNSMPIRDVEACATTSQGPLQVYANRGINGIDGVMSTAIGLALANRGRPTALLIGDVAMVHDLNAWVTARTLGVSLTVLVVNNGGGGIFSFLPVAEQTEHFETLFAAPQSVDFGVVAELGAATHHAVQTTSALQKALAVALEGGLHLIEVKTERVANVAQHRSLFELLARALEEDPSWR